MADVKKINKTLKSKEKVKKKTIKKKIVKKAEEEKVNDLGETEFSVNSILSLGGDKVTVIFPYFCYFTSSNWTFCFFKIILGNFMRKG